MNFINRNKYHFTAFTGIILLFVVTVFIRHENLNLPLSRHHEWLTAHTLITCEIWDQNGGPSAYHFSPVYTYPGEGNQRRTLLGGVTDEKGDVYYVSYPPFAFLFAYYSTQLIGGPSTESIHAINLAIHLICSLLIYLIAVSISSEQKKENFSIAGFTAAFLYLFSTGNLWFHGNLYFSDMLVQLFIIGAIYFTIRFIKNQYKREWSAILIVSFFLFLATYTEWLGLFLAFLTGSAFLVFWLVKKEKRYFKAFLGIGFSSALALAITVFQYTSIAGWDNLKNVSLSKYEERSGRQEQAEAPNHFTIDNELAYRNIIDKLSAFYKMAENFVGVFGIIFLLIIIIPNSRRRIENAGISILILSLLGTSILMHYYLFFNFNSIHDFSSLKTGFLFILFVLILISMIESAVNTNLKIGLFILTAILMVDKGVESTNRYLENFSPTEVDWNRIKTAEIIKKYSRKNDAVFSNIEVTPELIFHAKHAIFPVNDTTLIEELTINFNNTGAQYYHHEDSKLDYILEFKKENNTVICIGRTVVTDHNSGSGRLHQK